MFFSKYLIYVALSLNCLGLLQAQDNKNERKILAQSNQHIYNGNTAVKEDFTEAEMAYREALSVKPDNSTGAYNLGSSYYSSELYDEAIFRLIDASENTSSKLEKHKAFHNLGNALMKQNKCKEAVEVYKNALRNNPEDEETRYNFALAKECAKEKGGGKDENKQDENKQDENKEEEDENKKEEKEEEKEEENKKDPSKNKKEDKKPNEKKEKQKPQAGKMSPQQIKNLLEAMNNEERKVQEKMNAAKTKGVKIKTEKDW